MARQFNWWFMLTAAVPILTSTFAMSDGLTDNIPNPFGEHVFINPKQNIIDDIYQQQFDERHAQFSADRYALLFTPGAYALDVRVGYNTQVLGLGDSPDDVTIIGAVRTQDKPGSWDHGPGALNNFWRGVENLSIQPTLGSINYPAGHAVNIPPNQNVWAVSQAAPLRRIHIKDGDLRLFELGWSSGGFMANSKIDGSVIAGSQQQWYTRSSEWHKQGWLGGAWNMVLASNTKDSATPTVPVGGSMDTWPLPPVTWIPTLPVIVEKPYLTYTNNEWALWVPRALRNPKPGIDWTHAGLRKTLADIYIAKPLGHDQDDSTLINAALQTGQSIILTPGEYNLLHSIHVSSADTVILGLGLPTLNAMGSEPAIMVDDIDGARLAGFTVDAGPNTRNQTLIQVGPAGEGQRLVPHGDNPSALSDVYCRIGGEHDEHVTAQSCLTINSHDVVGDNIWLWRADHDKHYPVVVPHDVNPADTGIIINGDRVVMHGLAVEHFLKYQTIWNGDQGQLFFYQSELPYDVPSQWGHDGVQGYASLKINAPSQFNGYGVGVYCFFAHTPEPLYFTSAIESPNRPGIKFNHLLTVYLNGDYEHQDVESGILHIINTEGGQEASVVNTKKQHNKLAFMSEWHG